MNLVWLIQGTCDSLNRLQQTLRGLNSVPPVRSFVHTGILTITISSRMFERGTYAGNQDSLGLQAIPDHVRSDLFR